MPSVKLFSIAVIKALRRTTLMLEVLKRLNCRLKRGRNFQFLMLITPASPLIPTLVLTLNRTLAITPTVASIQKPSIIGRSGLSS